METILSDLYYNTKNPSCFSNAVNLCNGMKKKNKKVSRRDVDLFLEKQRTFTLHKQIRRRFGRNRVVPVYFNTDFQADLCDMINIKRHNSGYCYLLTVIEVLSRYAWAIPIKTKEPKEVVKAFEEILKSGRVPWRLFTDKGKEFIGRPFQEFLSQNDIQHITTESKVKCGMVERFNRTIKTRLAKYFTRNQTSRYIELLPHLFTAYNNTVHRSTGCAPSAVDKENAEQLWTRLYGVSKPALKFRFSVGDRVRVSRDKTIFEKGYSTNFTEEIYTVSKRLDRYPPVYSVVDSDGKPVPGVFYGKQLCKIVSQDEIFLIEKVLRRRVKNGIKEIFVKWKGYKANHNQWIKAADIVSPIL